MKMGRPLGPLARKAAEGERKGKTLISGSCGTHRPRDVTDMLATGPTFMPRAMQRLGPGDRQIEIVKGVMGKVPGRHNVKPVDTDDPYR